MPESCSPVRVKEREKGSHKTSQLASTRKEKSSEVPAKQRGETRPKEDEWGDAVHGE